MPTPPSWKQNDIFPLIAHIIIAQFQQHQRLITSSEIAEALLLDPEARRIIDSVVQQRGSTPQRTAINMVVWLVSALPLSSRGGSACSSAHA